MKPGLIGLVFAAASFPWVFRSQTGNFWGRMPLVAGCLGLLSLVSRPSLRRVDISLGDVTTGFAAAGALYGVFQVGDRFARRFMPRGRTDIADIYGLRNRAPRPVIAFLLAAIIAPGEELFWRGLLQDGFAKRYGQIRGAALASACYGLVHLGSGNLTLTGAAATAGAFWGLQYAFQRRMSALIVSHIAWDIWIFLIAPTERPRID
jgi:uncharacterized protein